MVKAWAGVIAAVVLLGPGAVARAAGDQPASVNETVKFPKAGAAELEIKAGPITFTEIIIRNAPNEDDLRQAKTNPKDNCHPKLQVGVTNNGSSKVEFHVRVLLEDDEGNVYMSCDRNDSISGGAENDHTNLCWLDSMKTIDWPKLTRVRLVAKVKG